MAISSRTAGAPKFTSREAVGRKSAPIRGGSPGKSVWRRSSSTQALDDQVAAITEELNALASNLERMVFTPLPDLHDDASSEFSLDVGSDFESPPKLVSPPIGNFA